MIRALPGSSLSLECALNNTGESSSSSSVSSVEWRKSIFEPKFEVVGQDSLLEIESLERAHSAKYYCALNDTYHSEFIEVKVGKEKPFEYFLDLNATEPTDEWTTVVTTEEQTSPTQEATTEQTTEITTTTTTRKKTSKPKPRDAKSLKQVKTKSVYFDFD